MDWFCWLRRVGGSFAEGERKELEGLNLNIYRFIDSFIDCKAGRDLRRSLGPAKETCLDGNEQ